jgi:hypothetical protein
MAKRAPHLEQYYRDAKRALAPYPLRTPEQERDYAIEWMASCNSYQDSYNELMKQMEEMRNEVLNARAEIIALKRQIAAKDQSFKPPSPGIA